MKKRPILFSDEMVRALLDSSARNIATSTGRLRARVFSIRLSTRTGKRKCSSVARTASPATSGGWARRGIHAAAENRRLDLPTKQVAASWSKPIWRMVQ